MVDNVKKAIRLDKSIKRWEGLILKCKDQLKTQKKEFKTVVKSMDMDDLMRYGEKAGYIPK